MSANANEPATPGAEELLQRILSIFQEGCDAMEYLDQLCDSRGWPREGLICRLDSWQNEGKLAWRWGTDEDARRLNPPGDREGLVVVSKPLQSNGHDGSFAGSPLLSVPAEPATKTETPCDDPGSYAVQEDEPRGSDEPPSPSGPPHDPRGTASGMRLWWHGDPEADVSRRWRVDCLLPEVGVALISGPWGSYKTFVAVDLALSLMVAGTFACRAVNGRCGVLYIAVEGASEIPLRLDGAIRARGLDQSRLPFARADECPRLLDRSALSALDRMVSAAAQQMRKVYGVELGLIIIDTMSAAAGFGDENSNSEAQRVMSMLTAICHKNKCLVAAIDHFGKLAETGTRGASAKEASADSIIAIMAEKDLAGNVSRQRLAIRKVRGAPTGAELPFSMRRVETDTDVTLAVEWAAAEVRTTVPAADRQRSHGGMVFREALIEALDKHGIEHRPYADGPIVRAVDCEQVRGEFYRRYPAEGDTDEKRQAARQKAFKRSLQQAQTDHAIGVQVEGKVTFIWLAKRT
jgi:AAA domain